MDSESLSCTLDFVAGSGGMINVERRIVLQSSFDILKHRYKFQRVLLWGRILGLKKDYFIAEGRGEDEMKDRKYMYSFNCKDWLLLPSVTDSMIEQVERAAKGRFRGEPSYLYQALTSNAGQTQEIEVTEEMRLAVTLQHIGEDVSVVPRGAFIKSCGLVHINRSFGGLSRSEAMKLDNFMHFREPKNLKTSVQEMGNWNPFTDFLDVLSDDDVPESWSLQWELGDKVLVLRSLLWLGLTFYHMPMTPQHGFIYVGDGLKNVNLLYML